MTQELLDAEQADRVRIVIGRASDFFGAGVTIGTTLGERVFGYALADKRADFIGNPDLPHTYSYVPDIAAGLATLGTDERAIGEVWHLPGPETVTTRELLDLLAGDVGHPFGVRNLSKLAVRALGVFNPMLRELAEMSTSSTRVRPRHHQVRGHIRERGHTARDRDRRDGRLVSQPERLEMFEAFAGLSSEGKSTARGAPRNPLRLGATLWHFRHESRATSPPIWLQTLILPPLAGLAKVFGVRPHYERWNSRVPSPTP
jgi:hypothetical protein